MAQFYSAVIESVLCSAITVWFGSASKSDMTEDCSGLLGQQKGSLASTCPAFNKADSDCHTTAFVGVILGYDIFIVSLFCCM